MPEKQVLESTRGWYWMLISSWLSSSFAALTLRKTENNNVTNTFDDCILGNWGGEGLLLWCYPRYINCYFSCFRCSLLPVFSALKILLSCSCSLLFIRYRYFHMKLDLQVYDCVNILPFHFVFTSIMVHNGLALTFSAASYTALHQ